MPLFDIEENYIKNLNEVGLPELIHQIMYYEESKLNLTHKGLNITLNVKTPDGGSDGEFINFDKPIPENHEFLPNRSIVFQFKATEIDAKAWFEKEILTKDKKELKPRLKALIPQGYCYYLITSKSDLPNFEEKEKFLKEIFLKI